MDDFRPLYQIPVALIEQPSCWHMPFQGPGEHSRSNQTESLLDDGVDMMAHPCHCTGIAEDGPHRVNAEPAGSRHTGDLDLSGQHCLGHDHFSLGWNVGFNLLRA